MKKLIATMALAIGLALPASAAAATAGRWVSIADHCTGATGMPAHMIFGPIGTPPPPPPPVGSTVYAWGDTCVVASNTFSSGF